MNLDLITKPVPANKIQDAINNILHQYMDVLTVIQDVGISKTVEEFKEASRQIKKRSKKKTSPLVTQTSP